MNLEQIIQNSKEPEVTRQVFDEIQKIGDNHKRFFEELTKRQDDLEVAFKRPGNASSDHSKSLQPDDLKNFEKAIENLRGKGTIVDSSMLSNYQKSFEWYLKNGGNPAAVVAPDNAKALSVGVDPDGGYLVTPFLANTITQRLYDGDPIRQLARIEILAGSDAWEEISDADDIDGNWIGETDGRTETDAGNIGKKRIPIAELYAMPVATQKLIEDGRNIEQWLSRKASDKFLRLEGAAFVSGDGIGKPRGFLTYDNGTNWGQVEQVAIGASPSADGLIDLIDSLQEEYRGNAVLVMNSTTLNYYRKLKDGTGNYLFMPDPLRKFSGFLHGYPVRTATTMPTVAGGALSVALADWQRAYTIVDRIGITMLRDPYTVKGYVLFYFRKRVGGDVVNFDALKLGVCS